MVRRRNRAGDRAVALPANRTLARVAAVAAHGIDQALDPRGPTRLAIAVRAVHTVDESLPVVGNVCLYEGLLRLSEHFHRSPPSSVLLTGSTMLV
jgi:hypothetical protein